MPADQFFKKYEILAQTISKVWNVLFNSTSDKGMVAGKPERQRLNVLKVLIATHEMEATDPQDNILALLIFGRKTHNIIALPQEIRPNYENDVTDVYVDFTR